MNNSIPPPKEQTQFIWKEPLQKRFFEFINITIQFNIVCLSKLELLFKNTG